MDSGAAGAGWRARVGHVEALSQLTPITGWEDKPLVSLPIATAALPVKAIAIHSQVSLEFGEEYKADHPADPRTADQLGAVHLYTCAWAEATDSLYAVLNAQLGKADRSLMKVWFLYLNLLLTALAAEPPYVGTLWRGITEAIGAEYHKGKKFRWWRFSSCTENGDVLKNPLFLGQSGKRTLFSIDCKTGVKIQHLSAFATEAEVLIPSGTRFEVAQTLSTGELTIVNLKEIGSGLLQMVPGEAASAAAQPHTTSAAGGSGAGGAAKKAAAPLKPTKAIKKKKHVTKSSPATAAGAGAAALGESTAAVADGQAKAAGAVLCVEGAGSAEFNGYYKKSGAPASLLCDGMTMMMMMMLIYQA